MACFFHSWKERVKKGMKYLRVHCGMYEQHINDAISVGLKSGDPVPGGEDLLKVGPYKIIPDGSLGTRTACCHHAYPSPPARKSSDTHIKSFLSFPIRFLESKIMINLTLFSNL